MGKPDKHSQRVPEPWDLEELDDILRQIGATEIQTAVIQGSKVYQYHDNIIVIYAKNDIGFVPVAIDDDTLQSQL